MVKAVWNGQVIAESDEVVEVEGNLYFPGSTLRQPVVRPSQKTTVCSWKGTAGYYDLVEGETVVANAVWVYRDPKPAAAAIKGHVAFACPPVTIER